MKFEKFKPVNDTDYSSGWNKFALDYTDLPDRNRIYRLTKELIYKIIEKNILLNEQSRVLDIACGTGNDFPFFLSKKAHISAFDLSDGMLNKAYEKYQDYIKRGEISLFKGRLENLSENTFSNIKYDLIYSVTGGFSYIDDTIMPGVFDRLKKLLKPGGIILSGHFTTFCIPEFIYYLLRWQLKSIDQRAADQRIVEIKKEKMTMYFRSPEKLKKMFTPSFGSIHFYPLLAVTPPYQTGYNPGKTLYNLFDSLERRLLDYSFLASSADQVIMIMKNL